MYLPALLAWLIGLLPIVVVNIAWLLNLQSGQLEIYCIPYLEGCMSVSRAVRSGPGLHVFRASMLPLTTMMMLFWWLCWQWRGQLKLVRGHWMLALGLAGAAFLILYATYLGTDGQLYKWLRRYGVVGYFAGTTLAQLLLTRALWDRRHELLDGRLRTPINWMMACIGLAWLLGCISPLKRLLITDPALQNVIENVIEWNFALLMSLFFVAAGFAFRRSQMQLATRLESWTSGPQP